MRWTLLLGLLATGLWVACNPEHDDAWDDDSAGDDDTGDDDTADDDTGDDDTAEGYFTATAEITAAYAEPSPVPEEPPSAHIAIEMGYVNTYAGLDITNVSPASATLHRVADDSVFVSLALELDEPWDQVVPAMNEQAIAYHSAGALGPPPDPANFPCAEDIYAVVEVNFGSGESVTATSGPADFACIVTDAD